MGAEGTLPNYRNAAIGAAESAPTSSMEGGIPPYTPPPPKKRKKGETVSEHGVRTTRYYSLSKLDLEYMGFAQGISTIFASAGSGFFFWYVQIDETQKTQKNYALYTCVFCLLVAIFSYWRKHSQLKKIRLEHDYPEDHLTAPMKIRNWLNGFRNV